jgi:hypothetical protein
MAITKGVGPTIAHVDAGGTTTSTVTLVGTTAGRSIVITVSWYNATAVISNITITGESNATLAANSAVWSGGSIDNARAQIAYLSNNTTGGDKTIVANLSAVSRFTIITATEIIGADLTDALDNSNNATATSTNAVCALTTVANAAIFGVAVGQSGFTKGANYTLIENSATNWMENEEYWLDSGGAGSKNVDWTNASTAWVVSCASFKAAGGTTTPITVPNLTDSLAGGEIV